LFSPMPWHSVCIGKLFCLCRHQSRFSFYWMSHPGFFGNCSQCVYRPDQSSRATGQ
jgi:hypothetical protein